MVKNKARKASSTPAKAGRPAQPQGQSQNTLVQLAVSGALLGLAMTLCCFLVLGLWQLPQANNALLQNAAGRIADSQAMFADSSLQRLQTRLAQLSDPELITALEQGDAAALSAWERAMERRFPAAVSARLIPLGPLGIAGLRRDATNLRNNIEIDLLRGAAAGQPAGPEAYQVDGRWLISIAQPVVRDDAGGVAGALLLTLPASYFTSAISDLYGRTSLVQTHSQKTLVFSESGAGDLEVAQVEQALAAPQWRLRFTPSARLAAEQHVDTTLLWALAAISIAAILAGALLTAHLFRRMLLRNIAALANGNGDALTLPGFAGLRAQIAKRLAASRAAASIQPSAPASVTQPEPRPPAPAPTPTPTPTEVDVEEVAPLDLPAAIFRAYDIRGLAASQLSDSVVYHLGLAIGTEALERGQQSLVVARDGRESSPAIAKALIEGLRDSGRDVIDLGLAPTPLLYFATHKLGTQSGVMVTGSHNPAEYNGLKLVLGGRPVAGPGLQALRQRIEARQFAQGAGSYESKDQIEAYIDAIAADVAIAQPLKIVVDAGNGVAGCVAPRLFQALGCDVVPLYCEVDGRFPNHHPDPTVAANLADLVAAVKEHDADLGLAFDGDGDRLGAVTASGRIVPADLLLMLMAQDVVSRNPGADVIFDVKCSRHLNTVISQFGGRPIMWKSGHSFMKEKMLETGALLGGEFSGHIYFKERWFGFDDALYAGARLIEILSTGDPSLDNQLATLPSATGTPELRLQVSGGTQFDLVDRLTQQGQWGDGKISTLDGIRVDYPDSWGLVRASNTESAVMLRFEADDEAGLARIQQLFREQMAAIDPAVAARF